MKRLVIDSLLRPHITDEGQECWCKPRIESCTCGSGCGDVAIHRFLEARPDTQPRMSCYSEQRPL